MIEKSFFYIFRNIRGSGGGRATPRFGDLFSKKLKNIIFFNSSPQGKNPKNHSSAPAGAEEYHFKIRASVHFFDLFFGVSCIKEKPEIGLKS